jgi:hypothetical protein
MHTELQQKITEAYGLEAWEVELICQAYSSVEQDIAWDVESSWEESEWVPEDPAGVMIETCLDAGRPLAYIPEEHRAWYQSLDYFMINGIIHDYRGLRIRDSWIRNGLKNLNIKPVFTHNI